ncbi:MAG: phosphoesterase PA-phosphatase, partial [Alphaproteobacteria bacterium]|nr:phosphoesterase PA-phosphatase [Alphaproteobacteria bacterium]
MKNKGKFLIIGISGALFALLIVLLRCVDGEAIGAAGTSVGLSHLNRFVFELTGVNMVWYNITDWLGLTAIIAAFLFAATGLVQVIKRRSILKVDKEILALGGLYILVIGIYVLFENVIVNYRPIIMPGCSNPEASFPSSHTMLVCVIMGSAIIIIGKYIKKKSLCMVIRGICAAVIAVT